MVAVWLSASRVDEARQHGVDRVQRPRRDGPADLFGDQREVRDTVARDAATTEFLGDQQARPAQFGGPPPPVGSNGVALECNSRTRLSGASFSRKADAVEAKRTCSGAFPLRSWRRHVVWGGGGGGGKWYGWLMIRLIGPVGVRGRL